MIRVKNRGGEIVEREPQFNNYASSVPVCTCDPSCCCLRLIFWFVLIVSSPANSIKARYRKAITVKTYVESYKVIICSGSGVYRDSFSYLLSVPLYPLNFIFPTKLHKNKCFDNKEIICYLFIFVPWALINHTATVGQHSNGTRQLAS